jgi:hypothetical protein
MEAGRFGEREEKPFLEKGKRADAVAPPVGRRTA